MDPDRLSRSGIFAVDESLVRLYSILRRVLLFWGGIHLNLASQRVNLIFSTIHVKKSLSKNHKDLQKGDDFLVD